jgi:cysteinyl-tRNA synthetase
MFFNTMTRQKEVFKPLKENEVTMYTCGPTVYSFPHIGNFRSFIAADIIRRYLEYKGYKVKYIMNITDIDDKTIRDSGKEDVLLKKFTEKYAKIFFEELEALNIKKAFKYPYASENFDEMLAIVKALVEKGYAYEKMGSVYFDISKFKDYGKLSKLDMKSIKIGARIDADEYEKDSPVDFVLLKRSTTEELKRGIFYDTEWGKVRPGWHIECSALSMKYLGETIDIHTGGRDLIFPHHENEIAQSESYTGKKFVNYWLHTEFLQVNGEKMAKSKGNFITLKDLIEKGYDPKAIRYLLLSAHYRSSLNFTEESLNDAENTIKKLNDFIGKIKRINVSNDYNEDLHKRVLESKKKFEDYMDDDLNMPQALASIFDLIHDVNKALDQNNSSKENLEEVYRFILDVDRVLGIIELKEEKLPKEIMDMITKREGYRRMGDFVAADKVRRELAEKGILVEDTPEGTVWRKIK